MGPVEQADHPKKWPDHAYLEAFLRPPGKTGPPVSRCGSPMKEIPGKYKDPGWAMDGVPDGLETQALSTVASSESVCSEDQVGFRAGTGQPASGYWTRSSLRRADPFFSCGGKPALSHPSMSASERNPEQGTVQGQGSQDTHSQSLLTPSGYLGPVPLPLGLPQQKTEDPPWVAVGQKLQAWSPAGRTVVLCLRLPGQTRDLLLQKPCPNA